MTTDIGLLRTLKDLGNAFGPLGVALAAADLTDVQALIQRLTDEGPLPAPDAMSPSGGDEPLLGLATTEELFREIITRFAMLGRYPGPVERALVLAEMLGSLSAEDREYRTVDVE